ncbi:hypothetical protein [uncultured Ruminococcus sp.]|uniref:hypothetical protein n=1 Tax=uncultured Ruminococcus sp. TaxID=165186 RepID=UPI0025D0CCB2|nr:hypothetical protein [uncultured Ruminococcus sp.]
MGKKAKNEVDEKSAAVITDAVLAENDKKLKELSASIQNALKRKQKIITDCKLYTYGQLSELYGGIEGQALLDAVTAEHTLIGKLTDSGMSYADIEGLVDSSDGADSKSGDDADSDSADDEFVGQTSFFGDNSYKD